VESHPPPPHENQFLLVVHTDGERNTSFLITLVLDLVWVVYVMYWLEYGVC